MLSIGAHVDPHDPLAEAKARKADLVQLFFGDPQDWKAPVVPDGIAALRDAGIPFYVHAPYVVNVASPNNKIRIPSRKILDQHAKAAAEQGAAGLIVHGGHVTKDADPAEGFASWRKVFERSDFAVPILIENTAGGDNAMARRFDALARLWEALDGFEVGFCLDTCHAHAAGEELLGIVDRVQAITGRIDLVHLNDSKDDFDSGRDRHDNIGSGNIDPNLLLEVVRRANAPVVCETPGGAQGQGKDIAFVRAGIGS